MLPIVPSVIPSAIASITDVAKNLIDRFIPDKNKASEIKAQFDIEAAKIVLEQAKIDAEREKTSLSAINSEAQSQDKWTSRARPAFMYVIYIMLLSAIPMGFLSAYNADLAHNIVIGFKEWLGAIPGQLYQLFGMGYLGYTGFRTVDKWKKNKNKQ